jgi:outer membrane murein-binding lipoprotein Lpp
MNALMFPGHRLIGLRLVRRPPLRLRAIAPAWSACKRILAPAAVVAVLLLAGCASTPPPQGGAGSADQVRARVLRLLPAQTADREAWARDITVAFTSQDIAATTDNVCAVLAVTEQESSFQADPAVPGLPAIARREIDRRAQSLHVPGFVVNAALDIESPTGKTYKQRLETVRTERQLSEIFEDFIGMVPMGSTLFSGLNPVHTGGPMQVSVAFAQEHAKDYPYTVQGSIRKEVFSRRGGVYFGVAHLLGYPTHYDAMLYRFADFNAGWYASRNAAFQSAVSRASGIPLTLDGDVVLYGSDQAGQTERAVRALRRRLGLADDAIHQALSKGETLDFEDTALYRKVFALADGDAGRPLPRAMLPGITLESPKITRTLTTAWFANRVQERWKRCMGRAGA